MIMSGSEEVCEQCGWDDCPWFQDSQYEDLNIICPRCGWTLQSKPRIDRAHQKWTGEKRYLLSKRGTLICHTIRKPGHGIYRIGRPDGGGVSGTIGRPIDDEVIELFRARFAIDEVDETQSYLAKWDPGAQAVVEILGTYRGPHRADPKVELPPDPEGDDGNRLEAKVDEIFGLGNPDE